MTVIAFPRRPSGSDGQHARNHPRVEGTFQSPRGRRGSMHGTLRVRRFVLGPDGLCLSGVFTAELREDDGTLIGVDSRRATVPVEVVHDERGSRLVVAPVALELMGIVVDVRQFVLDPPPLAVPERRG